MPKDNVEAAIKRAAGKDAANFAEINYEGKGPHGVLVFVECATDNNTRTVANVKMYFNKSGGSLSPSGSLEFMFARKAVIEFEATPSVNVEELELELIDSGLEEIEQNEDTIYIYGDYKDFNTLYKALEEKKIHILKAGLKRIPTNPQEFSEEQMVEIEKLIDRIEEDEDVQAVYTNIL
jgi:YebC/PmpR family DNA-binding regulatory protein